MIREFVSMFARLTVLTVILLGAGSLVATEAQVQKVQFDLVEERGAPDPWFEVAATFNIKEGEEGNPRFANEVVVSFSFAVREKGRERDFRFYSAEAIYPTLEVGRHVARFYLIPELTNRDEVKGEPFAFEIVLSAKGHVLERFVSPNLETVEALRSFRSRLEAERSSGFRLQIDTPFAWYYPRDTPHPELPRNSMK
ncbi:hypothetical protein [Pelagicoccus albus]|uniref:Uncharacterized protein n=1 Tax=Pelagicoccus albus TaxID=415222 RepID=A0A7X1B427_9BACT|nr:hypothetical protein [Pelagicoccus albus]MBC2605251.1 hypothetical protein [Pelagicoccus albus]